MDIDKIGKKKGFLKRCLGKNKGKTFNGGGSEGGVSEIMIGESWKM